MDILWHILIWGLLFVTVLLIPLGVPATFFIAGAVLIEGLFSHFASISVNLVIWLFALAVALEGLEYLITGVSAKHFGASRAGVWGAIFGGILGAIFGSGILPIIGTLVGTLAGAYLGAVVIELIRGQSSEKALRAGFGAFVGNLGGKLVKILGGTFMLILYIRTIIAGF